MPAAASLFRCPVCGLALGGDVVNAAPDDSVKTWRCAKGHSYDVGKDGTVHLLPAGHGKSNVVGDTVEMLQARRRFLQGGHYRPLTAALGDVVGAALPRDRRGVLVDFGCGEGTHLKGVVDALGDRDVVVAGLDLSKDAVKLAAKTARSARFVVGDSRTAIPLNDGVVDVGLVVFAPRGVAELARVMAPGSLLVVAIPQADHLVAVRDAWGGIGIADEKRERTVAELDSAFVVASDDVVVAADVALDGNALADLLTMTPSRRHLDDDVLVRARASAGMSVGLRVRLLRCTRR